MQDCKTRFSLTLFTVCILVALGAGRPVSASGDQGPDLAVSDLPALASVKEAVLTRVTREHLRVVNRMPLPDGLTPQETGSRAVQVAEEFVQSMRQAGWELRRENRQRRGGEFYFRKQVVFDVKAVIAPTSHPAQGRMKPCVQVTIDYTRRLPYADLLGRDPADVPRYPGSVRVRWMNLLGDFASKYLVVAPPEKVKAFFAEELPKLGWEEGRGVGVLNYRKGGVKTPADMPRVQIDKPLENIEVMIPTTLSVFIKEDDGLVEIGFGRSAGSADLRTKREQLETAITPEKKLPTRPQAVLTAIDEKKDLPLKDSWRVSRTLPVAWNSN
jgi:hypothetical protein